jgi:drug/metabolite transporter (DMT)-like permease
MKKEVRSSTTGFLYAILAAFLYSLVSVVAKNLVSGGTEPLQVTFYQYIFTVLILAVWILSKNRHSLRCSLRQAGKFALLGIIGGACTNILFYSALQYLNAGIASMLLFLHPVAITLFFAVSRIKILRAVNYFSVLLAAFGAAVVLDIFSDSLSFSVAGIIFGLLSSLTYAFYNVFADLKLKAEDPNVINFYACLAALCFITVLMLTRGVSFSVEQASLPPIFFIAAFSGVLPAYCFFKALQHIGSEKVSVVCSIELPMTLIMAFLILGERMKPIQLLGVVMIVAATILLHRQERLEESADGKTS